LYEADCLRQDRRRGVTEGRFDTFASLLPKGVPRGRGKPIRPDACNNPLEMPALLHKLNYTYADYLGFEVSSNVKHEFLDGQIYAMAGGTPEHAALAAAVITLLGPQLRGGECRPYNSDLRVRTPTGLTTYPDVTVVCGPRTIDAVDPLAVTNPALIVEVLSRSTEEYDSGDKFEHYKAFLSLREYVLVSHREHSVEVRSRSEDGWRTTVVQEGAAAELSIGVKLDIAELYAAAAEPSA
jgi:Uma2 family endonuclease